MTHQEQIASIKSKLEKHQCPFYIQLGHPVANVDAHEFLTIGSVFPSVFNENSESALIFWHHIPIRFHYTYELFWNIEGLLSAISELQKKDQGIHEMNLQTELLIGKIGLTWQEDNLKIESHWTGKSEYGPLADTLNNRGDILMLRSQFISEWHGLLQQAMNVLNEVQLENNSRNAEYLSVLREILSKGENVGKLYQNQ